MRAGFRRSGFNSFSVASSDDALANVVPFIALPVCFPNFNADNCSENILTLMPDSAKPISAQT
jgi:hypothetical protein